MEILERAPPSVSYAVAAAGTSAGSISGHLVKCKRSLSEMGSSSPFDNPLLQQNTTGTMTHSKSYGTNLELMEKVSPRVYRMLSTNLSPDATSMTTVNPNIRRQQSISGGASSGSSLLSSLFRCFSGSDSYAI